jgi:hypothetical protein
LAIAPKKNAVEKRIDHLVDQWNEFAEDTEAQMMRWLVDVDEARMIDVFLEVQNEEGGDVPDLFIRFEDPFDDPNRHGFVLLESLRQKYEETREDLREEDVDTEWVCPPPQPGDIQAFNAALGSLAVYYGDILENVVAVLLPSKVASVNDWSSWLVRLARTRAPQGVKFLVVDALKEPALDKLDEMAAGPVKTVKADLNMPGALEELARDVPGHGPGLSFRRLFVALSNAAAKGDLKGAQQAADSALSIAVKEGWLQMQFVVHMAMGGALLGAARIKDALESYRKAQSAAAAARDGDDPAGAKLLMQGKFAEGAALVADQQYQPAATVYEEAAAVARDQEDHLMTMEAWRMAAYCLLVVGDRAESWRTGQAALDAAEKMPEDQRANSTLPYVGQGLLGVAQKNKELIDRVHARMHQLAGPDWLKKLEEAAP